MPHHLINGSFRRYLTKGKQTAHTIKVAKKGVCVEAKHEGNLKFQAASGRFVEMKNVLVCENLSHNLISVKKIGRGRI